MLDMRATPCVPLCEGRLHCSPRGQRLAQSPIGSCRACHSTGHRELAEDIGLASQPRMFLNVQRRQHGHSGGDAGEAGGAEDVASNVEDVDHHKAVGGLNIRDLTHHDHHHLQHTGAIGDSCGPRVRPQRLPKAELPTVLERWSSQDAGAIPHGPDALDREVHERQSRAGSHGRLQHCGILVVPRGEDTQDAEDEECRPGNPQDADE
mmetsp:Transcript_118321/g.330009  ORF Transcript_118321/g.330009 Transcript_118321/m.330009 type:complete len:207 (+) Transcript_118321:117-737(+)